MRYVDPVAVAHSCKGRKLVVRMLQAYFHYFVDAILRRYARRLTTDFPIALTFSTVLIRLQMQTL